MLLIVVKLQLVKNNFHKPNTVNAISVVCFTSQTIKSQGDTVQLLHSVYKEHGLLSCCELCPHPNYEDTKHMVRESIYHIIYVNPYLTL